MGIIETKNITRISRNRVYLINLIEYFPVYKEEIIRAYTSLDRAEAYIKEYEKRNRFWLHTAINKLNREYSWFEDDYTKYCLRIVSYELDCEYDEETWIQHNPKKEES